MVPVFGAVAQIELPVRARVTGFGTDITFTALLPPEQLVGAAPVDVT